MQEIERIVAKYAATDHNQEQLALGTVVRVEESAYRRIGARMLVSSTGQWVGGISGGCLEGDALKQAKLAMQKEQSSVIVYDTREEDAHQIGVGLGCQGRIDVLFSPISPEQYLNQIDLLKQIKNTRTNTWLLQIISTAEDKAHYLGKIYLETGLPELTQDLDIDQEELQAAWQQLVKGNKSRVLPFKNKQGANCDILFECIRPKVKLICVGDNYDVNAFAEVANTLGWELHVVGKTRKLNRRIFQLAKTVSPLNDLNQLSLDDQTAVVLMSHDFKTDKQALDYYLEKHVPYIGLLGPRKRMVKLQDELAQEKWPDLDLNQRSNIYGPVGLDIGAESPEEIALSITAEIIAVLRDRPGNPLRERPGPIHERIR